jgi:DNA-binding response OmpR family regulator
MLSEVSHQLLVVEDDDGIALPLVRTLEREQYDVERVATGTAALDRATRGDVDLVVLDLGLPDVDGLTIIGMVRAASSVPILVVTAVDDDPTMIKALDAGADDYIVKPFGIDQVTARIRAVLRRSRHNGADDPITVGDLTIHARTRTARLGESTLELARKEFDLLLALAQRPGEVVSKRELLAEVWQQAYGGSDRTVDVHLSWLRRKLGETAAAPRYLVSVRGVGVRLVDPTRV